MHPVGQQTVGLAQGLARNVAEGQASLALHMIKPRGGYGLFGPGSHVHLGALAVEARRALHVGKPVGIVHAAEILQLLGGKELLVNEALAPDKTVKLLFCLLPVQTEGNHAVRAEFVRKAVGKHHGAVAIIAPGGAGGVVGHNLRPAGLAVVASQAAALRGPGFLCLLLLGFGLLPQLLLIKGSAAVGAKKPLPRGIILQVSAAGRTLEGSCLIHTGPPPCFVLPILPYFRHPVQEHAAPLQPIYR